MGRLPWLEILLIVALAVALIVKAKPNEIRTPPQNSRTSMQSSHTPPAGSFVGLAYR